MDAQKMGIAELDKVKVVEMRPGLYRRTLVYNDEMMLCHFILEQGVKLELHQHAAVQSGYVIKGRLNFIKGDGTRFVANAGTSYIFDSNEIHGIEETVEASEVVECFTPMRPEYL